RYLRNRRSSWREETRMVRASSERLDGFPRILLHAPDRGQELGMADAQPRGQGHALPVALVADALMDELIGDGRGQGEAMLPGDDMEHQIESRDPAGPGEAVAVDLEELGGHLELGKLLDEAGEILPT